MLGLSNIKSPVISYSVLTIDRKYDTVQCNSAHIELWAKEAAKVEIASTVFV